MLALLEIFRVFQRKEIDDFIFLQDLFDLENSKEIHQTKIKLAFFSLHSPEKEKVAQKILKYLSLAKIGFKLDDVHNLIAMNNPDNIDEFFVEEVLNFLVEKLILVEMEEIFCIINPEIKKMIRKQIEEDNIKPFRTRISNTLDHDFSTLQTLEERIYQLIHLKQFQELKNCLSNIQNFLILFTPQTKIQLFNYWKELEKLGYDPITDLIKSMESFEMHSLPSPQDLFKLILQISRFFKEYTYFGGGNHPDFWHPGIQNKFSYKNMKNSLTTSLISDLKPKKLTDQFFDELTIFDSGCKGEIVDGAFEDETSLISLNDFDDRISQLKIPDGIIDYLKEIGIYEEFKDYDLLYKTIDGKDNERKRKKYNSGKKKKKGRKKRKNWFEIVQELNVKIPQHMLIFRKHHQDIVYKNQRMREKRYQELGKDSAPYAFYYDNEHKETNFDINNINRVKKVDKSSPIEVLKNIDLTLMDPMKKSSSYHYKRWLWIMFPWCCLSVEKSTFSWIVARCFKSNTKYMSLKEESKLRMTTLKIAYEAKLKELDLLKTKSGFNFKKKVKKSPKEKRKVKFDPNSKSFLQSNISKIRNKRRMRSDIRKTRIRKDMKVYGDMASNKKEKSLHFRNLNDINSSLPKIRSRNASSKKISRFKNSSSSTQIQTQNKSLISLKPLRSHRRREKISNHMQNYTEKYDQKNRTQVSNFSNRSQLYNNISDISAKNILGKRTIFETVVKPMTITKGIQKISSDRKKLALHLSLNFLNSETKEKTSLELKVMQAKIKKLKDNLNKVSSETIYQKIQLDKLKSLYLGIKDIKENDDEEILKAKYDNLVERGKEVDESQSKVDKFQSRMKMIIDLCEINRNVNHKWLDTLKKLSDNYAISIKSEKKNIRRDKIICRKLKQLLNEFIKAHQSGVHNQSKFLLKMSHIQSDEKYFEDEYRNFNDSILQNIEESTDIDESGKKKKKRKSKLDESFERAEMKLGIDPELLKSFEKSRQKRRTKLEMFRATQQRYMKRNLERINVSLGLDRSTYFPDLLKSAQYKKVKEKREKMLDLQRELLTKKNQLEILQEKIKFADYKKKVLQLNSTERNKIHKDFDMYNEINSKKEEEHQQKLHKLIKMNSVMVDAFDSMTTIVSNLNIDTRPLVLNQSFVPALKIKGILQHVKAEVEEQIGKEKTEKILNFELNPAAFLKHKDLMIQTEVNEDNEPELEESEDEKEEKNGSVKEESEEIGSSKIKIEDGK